MDAFGNALGNAAIAGIERENQVAEQKQLQASIEKLQATQSAELGAGTDAFEAQTGQMASDYINASAQATLDQDYASTEQALEDRLASMPDPSLAASIAAVNGNLPRGTVTVEPLQIIEEGGRYGNAARQQEADFEAMNAYLDSVTVDYADVARVNAANARQYAADQAQQYQLEELDGQSERYLATLPYQIGKGALETGFNAVAASPQQIWNGLRMYGAADLDYAAASASLAGNNTASVQLSDAADATRTAALQPAWVPFQNLSPEEQFGGDIAMVAGLFTGYGEAEIGSIGEFGGMGSGARTLDAFGSVPNLAVADAESVQTASGFEKALQTYWPPDGGFWSTPTIETLQPGYQFSRYGGFFDENGVFQDLGAFGAPVDVPYGMRALAPGSDMKPLSVYEVVKPMPDVLSGKASPWFGELGLGQQHQLPMTIQDYLDQGYIKLINRDVPQSH